MPVKPLILLTASFLLTFLSTFQHASTVKVSDADNNNLVNTIIKSPNDLRSYQSFELANKLRVVVISDPSTDKAAVSLDIDVGSASNPINRPGLAHFLEHMLFLGTKKYPSAKEYSTFIDTHGGSQNAFTSQDNTNYFFDIKQDALEQGLARFSQFFIAPLLSEKYTDREKQAVHSEYQSRLKDDSQRNYSAFKQVMNPNHPGSRFFVGSIASLSDNKESKIRDDLMAFYQRYYSANRMTLVILGKEPVSKLKIMAEKYFSPIKNSNAAKPVITQKRFKDDQLPFILKVKTLKDFRQLTLTFPTPPAAALYRQKPLYYLSSLVGYEGEGSLISYLKKQGLANALSAQSSDESNVESVFQTSISLTEKGLQNTDLVIESFFSFIKEMKDKGITKALYKEQQILAEQAFAFLPKQSPSGYVVWLSQTMREYPIQYWLNANYLMDEFDKNSISKFLNYVTPENMFINIQAKSLNTNKTEPYFGGEYSSQKVTPLQLNKWQNPAKNTALFIRGENPYIAENLSITNVEAQENAPTLAANNPTKYEVSQGVSLWHLKDSQFLTPKANVFFTLFMPQTSLSTRDNLSLNLYAQLLNDKFNKQFYDAGSAGIYINLYAHRRGLSIRVSGYNDKQALVIDNLEQLSTTTFLKERFEILKTNYQRSIANSLKEKPYQQLISLISQKLTGDESTIKRLDVLNDITLQDITAIAQKLFSEAEIRILSHGNIQIAQAKTLAEIIVQKLNVDQNIVVDNSDNIMRISKANNDDLIAKIDNSDSAVALYLQGNDKSYKQRASSDLISEIIATDYSNQLRTEQQLGYLVFASSMNLQKLPGIVFIVQSPEASPEKIQSSNQQFLKFVTKKLQSLNIADLSVFKQSLITRYQTQERTISQRSRRFWRELNTQVYGFNEKQLLVEAANKLSLKDLQQSWQSMQEKQLQAISYSNALKTK